MLKNWLLVISFFFSSAHQIVIATIDLSSLSSLGIDSRLYNPALRLTTAGNQKFAVHTLQRSDQQSTKGIVVLCHGLEDSGRNCLKELEKFFPEYHIIAPDFPGHGDSSGRTTYGVTEYECVDATLKHIYQTNNGASSAKPVFLVGISMGGAAALKALGLGNPEDPHIKQVVGIITEGAPGNLYQAAQGQVPILQYLPWLAVNSIAGADVKSTDIAQYGANIKIPVHVIHSKDDAVVNFKQAGIICSAVPNSQLISIKTCIHGNASGQYPSTYKRVVNDIFDKIIAGVAVTKKANTETVFTQ